MEPSFLRGQSSSVWGVEPRTELAEAAGLEVDNGVTTDGYLATSVARIHAAGDVANVFYPAYGTRI
jgi:3-phenylpropionate/trans-cinnamate dioxygenase ferredoxin reductase subunit